MNPAQIILFIVVIVLTSLLVALGIQVFYVLREFRQTLSKTNKILDTATQITDNLSNPVNAFSSILTGVKTGNVVANLLKKVMSKGENGKQQ